jgi:transcription elongation GreA/GreB family factor
MERAAEDTNESLSRTAALVRHPGKLRALEVPKGIWMSRAFVKEVDDAPPPPPPERPVSKAPNLVTPRGARLIDEAVAALEREIAAAADEAAAAPLRRDLRYWLARRASARLTAPDPAPQAAGFGARVTIRRGGRESEVEIVGEDEADPDAGFVAWTSPLARALEEAEPGDVVELAAGGRSVPVTVLAVAPGSG